jgi:hypothetical protein
MPSFDPGSPPPPGPDESEPSPGVAAGVGSALSPPPGGLPIMLGDYGDDTAPSPDDPPAPGE